MKKFYTFLILVFTVVVGNAQIVNIPDANFKAKLLAASSTAFIALDINFTKIKIDTNNDGEISVAEAQVVRRLFVSNSNISNLTGIGSFTNLLQLNCSYNQLTALDVNSITGLLLLDCQNNSFLSSLSITNCNALTTLNCDHNVLSALDVSANVNLTDLSCNYNQLTNLNINNCFALTNLQCSNNLLTSLNVTNRTQLTSLGCSTNQLTTLDLSGLTSLLNLGCILNQISNLNVNSLTTLTSLECGGNQLTALNVSNLVNLDYLNCHSNFIQALDVSNLTHLSTLICKNNNLNYLNLKNGYNYTLSVNEYMYTYCIDQNPLSYICADDNKIQSLQDYFGPASTININSYCSFNPGGTFYTIQGNHRWDVSGNGCDSSDFMFPNMKLTINSASNAVTLVSGANGSYHFNVPAGTYTLTPIVENPSYFVVSPASVSVTFPSTTSLFTQDFCISANGIRNDLEVSIIPLGPARPGFVAYYKIIYKNKGNNAQTGTVNLVFEDAKMDLFSASPTTTIASFNNLSWSFSNLLPFETREILFTMDINSPMETPAVNIGDVLHFTATVVGLTDQTPNDNTAVLNQVTINGLDPNDKTCSEGTTVSPSTVGQYVHYVIRFENTGTANAQNIVVKDMIDTAKYDVSSLLPLSGSAPFTTRIINTNQVEFIFQNINLPFNDGNNDGYVAFKIKTKPTLVVGNTFSNNANIYFDYNFPITTNTYTTTITALGTQDFEFGSVFSLSPVPTKNVLTITTKQDVVMSSASIYNILGQLVQVSTNPNETIDVSGLKTGSYFIKIISDKGTASGKFLKE